MTQFLKAYALLLRDIEMKLKTDLKKWTIVNNNIKTIRISGNLSYEEES